MKTYDVKEVEELKQRIENAILKTKSAVHLTRKKITIVKAINPQYSETLYGKYNGYGYTNLGKHLFAANYEAVLSALPTLPTAVKKETKKKTKEEKIEAWCRRLAKLGNIPANEAREIAEEKLAYQAAQVSELDERQNGAYSSMRATLIKKMVRANPLRWVRDADHAQAILAARDRHKNTRYEALLKEGRELAENGVLDRSEVRTYAREMVAEKK